MLNHFSLGQTSAAFSAYLQQQYTTTIDILLARVAGQWLSSFTRAERAELFDPFFSVSVPTVDAFLAVTSAFCRDFPSDSARTAGAAVMDSLFRARFVELLQSLDSSTPVSHRLQREPHALCSCLLAWPRRCVRCLLSWRTSSEAERQHTMRMCKSDGTFTA